jgi:alpha-mannosidase
MPPIETIYIVHHSHTDIGYTHDQPILWEMQARFIDEALDAAERYADFPDDSRFRWTVETTAILDYWLKYAKTRDIDRFVALEKAGLIEVTGMLANMTPLIDIDQTVESLQLVGDLRRQYGFNIRSAMNCDVNGHNWPLVDLLLDAGIRGFSMAINVHFGGAPTPRPYVFNWQGPSGQKLHTYNGWHYGRGNDYGIGRDAAFFRDIWWPKLQDYLDELNYPIPVIMLQNIHPFGDNGSAVGEYADFIREWNAGGNTPRIVFATPGQWWDAVATYNDQLPVWRGDWTDYWNFGCISSAREQTIDRQSRARLRAADALYAGLRAVAPENHWADRSFTQFRDEAWHNLAFWSEHTWGADNSIRQPNSEDALTQWHHKAHTVYQARSLSLLLLRDALGDFSQHITREDPGDVLLFNPLPWPNTVSGVVSPFVIHPRGLATDTTAGRHAQDRDFASEWRGVKGALLPPTEVPAFGYTVVPSARLVQPEESEAGTGDTVENHRYRLTFDREHGGITSLYDKTVGYEWVDAEAGYPFYSFVHEAVAEPAPTQPRHAIAQIDWSLATEIPRAWKTGWGADRLTANRVLSHRVLRTPFGWRVEQRLEAPGEVKNLRLSVFLADEGDYIDFEGAWEMSTTPWPEATYLLFPFRLPGATARFNAGGQPVIPDADQLPGVCRDYFTTHDWVDFSDGQHGVTIAMPENPMVQLGGFHFGDNQYALQPERAMLLGWVTNNYWETNFRAHQPGEVTAFYRVLPYAGAFDEARAHRFGLEAANRGPVEQHMGEPQAEPMLPAQGTLLHLPGGPVLTIHMLPGSEPGTLYIRLYNASDAEQMAAIESRLLHIHQAWRCDLFNNRLEALTVTNGAIHVALGERETLVVEAQVTLG